MSTSASGAHEVLSPSSMTEYDHNASYGTMAEGQTSPQITRENKDAPAHVWVSRHHSELPHIGDCMRREVMTP